MYIFRVIWFACLQHLLQWSSFCDYFHFCVNSFYTKILAFYLFVKLVLGYASGIVMTTAPKIPCVMVTEYIFWKLHLMQCHWFGHFALKLLLLKVCEPSTTSTFWHYLIENFSDQVVFNTCITFASGYVFELPPILILHFWQNYWLGILKSRKYSWDDFVSFKWAKFS